MLPEQDNAKRIMYVDDDPEDRILFEDAIQAVAGDFVLNTAADGVEALKYLNDPNHPTPTLVVVDLNMPRMNGKELIENIRQDDQLSSLKMVVLTTSSNPEDRADCARYGVDMYTKPVTFDELKQTVSQLLSTT